MPNPAASTASLEAIFFVYLILTILGASYGLATPLFALFQSGLGFAILLLLWPKDQVQLFSATRSTFARYKTSFLELCALIYMACAVLSILERIRTNNYSSYISLMLRRRQDMNTIAELDCVACLAIVASHLTGHHDICDRIYRRLSFFCWCTHKAAWDLCAVCDQMLQEPPRDLEAPPYMADVSLIDLTDPVEGMALPEPLEAMPLSMISTSSSPHNQEISDVEEMDDADASKLRERFPHLRRLSLRSSPYPFMHQELRSIGARLRWSDVRYRLGFQKRPLQDVLLLAQTNSPEVDQSEISALPPQVQLSPKKLRSSHSRASSLSSIVTEIMVHNNAHRVHRLHPLEAKEYHEVKTFDGKDAVSDSVCPPIFQLPGTIQNMCVKALPDTGSSQNIIDKALVQELSPPVNIRPLDATDMPLEAPDREPIPCIGKVRLPWLFNGEDVKYEQWFYVVEDCSKGVIIGNGFLQQTGTMDRHRDRLEVTKPPDPNGLLGKLVSETQQGDRLRQLVHGTINGTEIDASLDTGSQANLMSADYAGRLGLEVRPLPTGQEQLEFANGRRGSILGQVAVDWSFSDTPEEKTKVTFYVLRTCIHPVIFGDRFVYFQDPWVKHLESMSQVSLDTADIGVVGLENKRRFWFFGNSRPDPLAQQIHNEKKARKERAMAELERNASQSQAQVHFQPTTLPAAAHITPDPTFAQGQSGSSAAMQATPRTASQTPLAAVSNNSTTLPSNLNLPPAAVPSPPASQTVQTQDPTGGPMAPSAIQLPPPAVTV